MQGKNEIKTEKPARATLKDVARLAGVSDISVSRVMRNAPNISDALREKVTKAANALGYTPNRVAGALKSSNSTLVAVVLPSMSNEVFSEVFDGIEAALGEHGLNVVLGLSNYDLEREKNVVRELLSWSPMGIILTGLHHDADIARMIEQLDIPVVQIMDTEGEPLQSAVGISHTQAAEAAAEYLVGKGYKAPAYIGAWNEKPDRSRTRRVAFESRLAALGVPLVASKIMKDRSSAITGAEATRAILAEYPQIDCIFYANDDLALGGLFHCMSAGLSVPRDLGLLGFNGIEIGRATPIKLSSVETPRYEMGEKAAELLLEAGNSAPRTVELAFSIFEGEST